MPWYRAGTVSATAGQTTITGVGTNFPASGRVGDAFQGPDGRWYEVTNIASNLVLSILPAYQGPTIAGGSYALAPLQGYVKESADRLRQFVEQFGGTLALFGNATDLPTLRTNIGAAKSGANSDITSISGLATALTVAQGGTGSTTAAGARTALGLGVAATRDVIGGTGPLMARGAYGLGGNYSPGLPYASDVSGSQIENTGIYRYDTNTVGRPTHGTGFGALIQMSAISGSGLNYGAQIGVDYASTEIGFRALAGNAGWLTWRKIYHDGNTTRAADGTLKAI